MDKILTGDYSAGHRLYKKAIKLNPRRIEAYKKLCASLQKRRPKAALRYCRQWASRETNPVARARAKQAVERIEAQE